MTAIETIQAQVRESGKVAPGVYTIDQHFDIADTGGHSDVDMLRGS